ncbi:hypothetical protein E2562_009485 [Oryza meyeriana var. granulata]|uniref:Protein TIFY n=1 Tax=Oryza meyeriana var. granulata TaxID=110450 RepID=A0A6G1BU15_9ORYZ|nr:hypothetical protein E2562_009485 [Oryza meyeriana var. granulata]
MAGSEQRPVARAAAAGSGSRFAVTCGLLRQYMKEHGGSNGGGRLLPAVTAMSLATGADAAVGAAAAEEVEAPEERKTMELFPQQAGTLKDSQERKETEKAQLTIFYGGSVVVFDDFPAEKVDELMKLAGSCDTAAVSDAGAAAACELSPGQPCLPGRRSPNTSTYMHRPKFTDPIHTDHQPTDSMRCVSTFLQTCPSPGRCRCRGSWRRGRTGSPRRSHSRRLRHRSRRRRRSRASVPRKMMVRRGSR